MEQGHRRETPRPREEMAPRRSNQRRRRNGGQLFSNPWVYLLFIFGISAVLAGIIWTTANDVLALNKPERTEIIVLGENDSYGSIINQLKDKEIIGSKTLFRIFSLFAGGKQKIAPGEYQINTDMDYYAIINGLSANSDRRMVATVTIPEHFNIDQTFQLLEESGVTSVAKLQETAQTHAYAFSFLQDIPLGNYKRLEGYLFPDTYNFYKGEDPVYVINKMLANFDSKITDAMRKSITTKGYTIHQIVIIASMIEKETDGTDRTNIASVIFNRWKKTGAGTNGKLGIDATIQYVLPEGQKVTQADYTGVDSPYNTHKYKGLPPGPICNPGMQSLYAAMKPADTGYFYYQLGDDKKHHFFKTLAEHTAFGETLK